MYNYCLVLRKNKGLENFRKVHGIFSEKLCFEMIGSPHRRFSSESQKIVRSYGSIYIKYPRFTYLRIRGFDDEPVQLPRYALDCFILVEVSRKLVTIINNFSIEEA